MSRRSRISGQSYPRGPRRGDLSTECLKLGSREAGSGMGRSGCRRGAAFLVLSQLRYVTKLISREDDAGTLGIWL